METFSTMFSGLQKVFLLNKLTVKDTALGIVQ